MSKTVFNLLNKIKCSKWRLIELISTCATFKVDKGNKVAIIGGGITGLTIALELGIKGYDVTIYEKSNELGGKFKSYINS